MGFFDTLGETLGDTIREKRKEMYEYAEELYEKSDDQLIRAYKNTGNSAKKTMILKELKDRGYGSEIIDRLRE